MRLKLLEIITGAISAVRTIHVLTRAMQSIKGAKLHRWYMVLCIFCNCQFPNLVFELQ